MLIDVVTYLIKIQVTVVEDLYHPRASPATAGNNNISTAWLQLIHTYDKCASVAGSMGQAGLQAGRVMAARGRSRVSGLQHSLP